MQKRKIVFPDYTNSILNLVASLLTTYGAESLHPPLAEINSEELRKKKNVVLMVFDGMGYNLLDGQMFENTRFLKENMICPITSVFPPTTAAAITSLFTGKSPLEHGVVGWTIFFKEYMKFINFLPLIDDSSGEKLDSTLYDIYENMDINGIFQSILGARENLSIYNIAPAIFCESKYTQKTAKFAENRFYEDDNELFQIVSDLVAKEGREDEKKLIFSYSANPDALQHEYGTGADSVKEYLSFINRELAKMKERCKGSDTTVLLTADHGLTDIESYISVDEDRLLYDSLIMPTFPEPRFVSFFVKPHRVEQFEKAMEKYGDDFFVMRRDEFFEKGLLGPGVPHKKLDDFIGSHIAIAIGKIGMVTNLKNKQQHKLTAHHSGLTEDEMLVPLIMFDC